MRTYREGATFWPFLAWAGLLSVGAGGCWADGLAKGWPEGLEHLAMGTILAMAGPLPLIAYLVRYAAVRVAIEPAGLRLSDRYFVRWSEIRSVERRGSRAEPLRLMEGVDLPLPVWILVSFLVVMTGFIFLLVLFWLLQSIVAPVFVLLSPWQRGVAIRLHDGTTLLYRDLSDADEFVSRVAQQIPA